MQIHETPLFTTSEAAVLTGLSPKAVNNAIDHNTVSATVGNRAGQTIRLLDLPALVSLTLERQLADQIAPEARRAMFDALAQTRQTTFCLQGGLVTIDLREPRRALAKSLWQLRRARQLVVTDPDLKGGEPVFLGTRVQVHLVAARLGRGATEAEMLEEFPRLTPEMVRLAPIYAAAYPLRGRPRAQQPWRDRPPVHQSRGKLAAIGVA